MVRTEWGSILLPLKGQYSFLPVVFWISKQAVSGVCTSLISIYPLRRGGEQWQKCIPPQNNPWKGYRVACIRRGRWRVGRGFERCNSTSQRHYLTCLFPGRGCPPTSAMSPSLLMGRLLERSDGLEFKSVPGDLLISCSVQDPTSAGPLTSSVIQIWLCTKGLGIELWLLVLFICQRRHGSFLQRPVRRNSSKRWIKYQEAEYGCLRAMSTGMVN